MNNSGPGKTFLDYRSSLRKVTPGQLGQPRVPPSTYSPPAASQTPLAFRQAQPGNSYTPSPTTSPQQQQQPFRKNSQSLHSQSSISSLRQQQLENEQSQSSFPAPQSLASPSIGRPSTGTPSLYSQQSLNETPPGVRTFAVISSSSTLPRDLQQYLQTVVTRHDVGAVVLLGPEEEALKQAKMQAYTVAGKLEKNLSVSTSAYRSHEADGLPRVLSSLQAKNLYGVLYVGQATEEQDVLDLDGGDMENLWQSSILALQTIARHTIPLLTRPPPQANGTSYTSHTPFFALEAAYSRTKVPSLFESMQDMLVQAIAKSPTATGVRMGYASEILAPPASPQARRQAAPSQPVQIPQPGLYATAGGSAATTPGLSESPTKLWASWAMAQEDGG